MKAEYLQHKDGTRFVPITQPDAVINSEGKSLTTTLADMEEEIQSKSGGNVDDVKVDGTSVVTNKVANIDLSGKVDTTDSRLSDARTPLAHTHAISEVENLQSSLTALSEADSALSLNLQGKFDTPQSKTIEGFGITDAYTKDEVDSAVNAKISEPTTEGTSGQALVTDGEGGRSWQTVAVDTDEIEEVSASALVELREYIDSLLNGITTKGKIIMSNDIVNNLTSLSSLKPLSAFQGKLLNDKFNNMIIENEQITASAFCDMATKLKPTAIAPEYNSYTVYTEGQYTIYNGLLYKCTTTLEKPEFFNADHWSLTSVMAEFSNK